MISTNQFLSIVYGSAAFQATDYTWDEKPQIKKDWGRVGTDVTIKINGFVDGDTASEFITNLQNLNVLSEDGNQLTINGVNGALEKYLPPGICADNGPHGAYKISAGDNPMHRKVEFDVTALVFYEGDYSEFPNGFRVRTSTRPDGLVTITQTGEFLGPSPDLQWANVILPAFRAAYPSPNWIVAAEFTAATTATARSTYQMTATQLRNPLPQTQTATVVSGTQSGTTERNEQNALTGTTSYDLLLSGGDPVALHNSLRPTGVVILRETMAISYITELRLRSSFVSTIGEGGTNLLSWQQSMQRMDDDYTYELKTFPGAAPIAVQRPATVTEMTISGSATGLQDYVVEPAPPTGVLFTAPPEVSHEVDDAYHYITRWNYRLMTDPAVSNELTDSAGSNDALFNLSPFGLVAPTDPGFYSGGQGGNA
jgi:hypothetical protein